MSLPKYIKNLISELSSTSDPVDLDEEAFVKETGSTVIKKDLNVSISNSLFFAGHTSSNFLGAHLSMDSAFKFPNTGYDNAIEDKFSIDFQQYTLSDTNTDAEIFFDIVEKDSSIAQAVNLIPSQSSIAHVGGNPQIARGITPYRSGYGGSSYLFGDPEHGTISHPSGTYSSPSSTSSTTTVEERASSYGTDSGSYLISSLNVLDSSKSTHISMGGWYRKNDPQAQATISGYNNHSYSTSNFSLAQSAAGKTIINAKSGQPIAFKINNSDKVQISSAGNLGVGIETATEKLHVVGNVFATGNISGSATSTGSFGELIIDSNGTFGGTISGLATSTGSFGRKSTDT